MRKKEKQGFGIKIDNIISLMLRTGGKDVLFCPQNNVPREWLVAGRLPSSGSLSEEWSREQQ